MTSMSRLLIVGVFVGLLVGCATPGAERPQSNMERAAEINTDLGISYLRQGELEQAKEKLTKALAQNPNHADAHAAIAVLYDRLNEHDRTAEHFRRALQLSPQRPSLLNNYGRFLCERGDYAAAQEKFERALEDPLYRTPELPLSNAGLCALREGDEERAEELFLRALRERPRFAPALLRMAELRYEAGHHLSARGFYQRYLEVAQQTPETLWLGIRIEDALGDQDAVASYALRLRSQFPDSDEARKLLEMKRNER